MHTATTKDREALTVAHVQKYFDGGYTGAGSDCNEPLGAVTAIDHNALTLAHAVKFKGDNLGQPAEKPLQTITTSIGEFGAVKTQVQRYLPGADMCYWPDVRDMLNRFCGYSLADDEVLLINLLGTWYFIADIGLRMLSPRELFNAQGAPADYIIDRDADGKPYPKSEQVAKCGNMVCPPVAAALISANAPESARKREVA
jgi:DNA (cytosine-5)-methyltransferase 1